MIDWKKTILLSFIFSFIQIAQALPIEPDEVSLAAVIDSTDIYIRNADSYSRIKEARIKEARDRLEASNDSPEMMLALGREYRRFNVDSAARYFVNVINAANVNTETRRQAMLELAAVNPLRGIVKESIDAFEVIDGSTLSAAEKVVYFDKGFDLYLTTSTLYADDPHGNVYINRALEMSDSLVSYLPTGSAHQLYHKGWSEMQKGNLPYALAELHAALVGSKFGDDLFARIAATLAFYYSTYSVDKDKAMFYLALSAMNDVFTGTKETTSLQKLAFELYGRGDIQRAHRYLSYSLANSVESGSKLRTLNDFKILPVVSAAYGKRDSRRTTWLYVLLSVITVIMIVTIIMLVVIYKDKQRLAAYRARLARSNASKDEYISQILALCSSYIERLADLNTLIIRKVKTGQSQDLCRMAESGEMIKDQNEKFLRAFDKAYLKIHPAFAEEVNTLLREDAKFEHVYGEKMLPELRIAAFMRLGVSDCEKIARMLGLSLNTVYTYRNKLRNRAIDRENIEYNLRNLDDNTQ